MGGILRGMLVLAVTALFAGPAAADTPSSSACYHSLVDARLLRQTWPKVWPDGALSVESYLEIDVRRVLAGRDVPRRLTVSKVMHGKLTGRTRLRLALRQEADGRWWAINAERLRMCR